MGGNGLKSILRHNMLLSWALLGAVCLVYILRTRSVFYFEGGDNAHYLLLAKALASGKGYRDVFLAGSPAHTQYPPLFPSLLALVILFRGVDLHMMNMVVSLGAVIAFALTFILLRRRSFSLSLISILWFASSYKFFSQSDWLLSETVYMAFAAAALIACDKWLKEGGWRMAAAGLLACWAAELTRTAGVSLAIAAGAAAFMSRPRRRAASMLIVAGLSLLPFFVWVARNAIVSNITTDYFSQFLRAAPYDASKGGVTPYWFAVRILENIESHCQDLAEVFYPGAAALPEIAVIGLAVIFFALTLLGFYRRVRKNAGITEFYTAIYFLMIISWPFTGYRFMMPVFPFIIAYFIEGMYFVAAELPAQRSAMRFSLSGIFAIALCLSVAANAVYSARYEREKSRKLSGNEYSIIDGMRVMPLLGDHYRLLEACKWIARHNGRDARVMTRLSRLVALASGKIVVNCPQVPPEDPEAWLKENGVTYILMDEIYPDTSRFLQKLTMRRNEIQWLRMSYRAGDTTVLEIAPSFGNLKK